MTWTSQFATAMRNKNTEAAHRVFRRLLMFALLLNLCGLALSTAAHVVRAVRRA